MARRRRELAVLAIDAGIRTGWAVLDRDGGIIGTGSLGALQIDQGLDWIIRRAHLADRTLEAVLERMSPSRGEGHLAHELEFIRRTILGQLWVFELRAVEASPGEVRGPDAPLEWRGGRLAFHQRSAIRLGRYYLDKRDNMRRRKGL